MQNTIKFKHLPETTKTHANNKDGQVHQLYKYSTFSSSIMFYAAVFNIQQNFNGSNTDDSFTIDVSNYFLSPLAKSHSFRYRVI